MRVGLVGCVKSKQPVAVAAKDLYVSPLFRGRRRFVERTCDAWFILSALHGLVDPSEILAPYDKTLSDAGVSERTAWSRSVLVDLEEMLGTLTHTFEIHAGQSYIGFGLLQGLKGRGADVVLPVEGLSMGRQLAFYRSHG